MAPPATVVLRGVAFVIVGVMKALSDSYQLRTEARGKKTVHTFNHCIILLVFETFLQMLLLLLYFAIEKDWCGCRIFRHGNTIYRAQTHPILFPRPHQIVMPNVVAADEPVERDNGAPERQEREEEAGHQQPGPEIGGGGGDNGNERQEVVGQREDVERPRRRRGRNRKASKFLYFLPALFAVASVILKHFGLDLTYSSSFMMLKGSVLVFTALLSIALLAQKLAGHVWVGILLSCIGFVFSGISDYFKKPTDRGYEIYGVASGDLLIVMSQIVLAAKFVYEEKFIKKHSMHPMKFLGGEGVYAFGLSCIGLIVFCLVPLPDYYSYPVPRRKLEDVVDAYKQLQNGPWTLIFSFIASPVLGVLWHYLGLFLVRDHGALPRVMVETLVWLFYWAICLGLHWENFFISQGPSLCAIGVGLLFYGNILPLPTFCGPRVPDINRNALYPTALGIEYDVPLNQGDACNEANQDEEEGNNMNDADNDDVRSDGGGDILNNDQAVDDGNGARGGNDRTDNYGRNNEGFEGDEDARLLPAKPFEERISINGDQALLLA